MENAVKAIVQRPSARIVAAAERQKYGTVVISHGADPSFADQVLQAA